MHSDTRSYNKAARKSRLQETEFVDVYNHECDWVATCLNPQFRLEIEGTPIPVIYRYIIVYLKIVCLYFLFFQANEKILILHMKSNKAVGVVADFRNP